MPKYWLTVAIAAKEYNRSESSIKRLFYKLKKANSSLVKKEGRRIYIHISAFGDVTDQPNDAERPTTDQPNERPNKDIYIDVIEILKEELKEKNTQIERLQVDGDQKNRLIAHLQTRVLLESPKDKTERPTTDQPNERPNDAERPNDTKNLLLVVFCILVLILLVGILIQ